MDLGSGVRVRGYDNHLRTGLAMLMGDERASVGFSRLDLDV